MTPLRRAEGLGFDPAAKLYRNTRHGGEFVEARLTRKPDGTLCLYARDPDGTKLVDLYLREDFLDEFLAHARAREADAA